MEVAFLLPNHLLNKLFSHTDSREHFYHILGLVVYYIQTQIYVNSWTFKSVLLLLSRFSCV